MANLLHSKGSRTQIYKTLPSNNVGNDGDIILSQIQGRGVYLCSKVNGKWHVSSKMEELRKIEKTSTKDLRTDKLRVLDDLSIGRGTTQITKDEAKFSSSLKIKEAANAISDTTAYGQLWVKTATPNELYFTTDAGNDIQLTSGTTAAFVGDITSVVAGDGLTGGGTSSDVTLNVNVDDSTIETNSDALRIKDSGVTYAKMQNVTNARMLGNNSGGAAAPSEMTQANVLSFLGVEAGATADQTKSDIDGLAITTVGTIDTGTWEGTTIAINQGGTGATNSNAWLNSRITTNADGSLNYDATGATAVNHDSLTGFVSNEHIDWTGASAGTIHATNYTNTTYSVGDGGLTTNDFTNDDHTKLNGIAAGAEVNVQADWNEASSGSDAFIANKPTIPSNYVTNDADDTMAGTLTIDKDSTATTTSSTYGLDIDFGHTGITASGQTIYNVGSRISLADFTVTHVGNHNNYGIETNIRSNNSGTSNNYGLINTIQGADYNYGVKNEISDGTNAFGTFQIVQGATNNYGIWQSVANGGIDYMQVSSADMGDYFSMTTTTHGATTLATVDDDATAGHLTLDVDGDITLDAASGNIYVKDDGGNYTPGSDYEIATKKYVDDNDANTMGSGFTVSATTDSNATTITQGDDLMFAAGTGITCETTADGTVTITNTVTNTNQLTTFVMEDGDGTEVTMGHNKEMKFVEGTGIDIDWTNTSNGSDADPYDLTVTCNLEGTELASTGESGGNKYLREDGDGTCSWQTVSASGNFITDNADDTMAGALTIDKDSTATTSSTTKGLFIDFDHTGITASGQTISSQGLSISVDDTSVTHVGNHFVTGIVNSVVSNNSGTSIATGISNSLVHPGGLAADTCIGFSQSVPDGGIDIKLISSAEANDYFTIATGANGATTLATVDADAQLAHLTIEPDGKFLMEMNALDGEDDAWAITNNGINMMTFKSEGGAENFFKIYEAGGTNADHMEIQVQANGETLIKTDDAAGAEAHLSINVDGQLRLQTPPRIKEQASADADQATYGQLWVKTATPNELYFTTDAGNDIQITSGTSMAGGGGSSEYYIRTAGWARCQYNNWYYGTQTTYGNYFYWYVSTGSTSLPGSYADNLNPSYLIAKSGTITGYSVVGTIQSTDTFEWAIMKGAQPTFGSAGDYTLSQVGATQSAGGTSNILYKWEQTGLSVSATKNDIIMPFFRRTTDNDSTYAYCKCAITVTIEGS